MRAYTRNATSILSSELGEVDAAFLYGAKRLMAFSYIHSFPVLLQTTLRMRGKNCYGNIRKSHLPEKTRIGNWSPRKRCPGASFEP